jgi:hypothetical protein
MNVNENIVFADRVVEGKEVGFTAMFHVRKAVNDANKPHDVLTSNFYYDITKGAPYIKFESLFVEDFELNYPHMHSEVVKELKDRGVVKQGNPSLITRQAVLDIFYVYGIDPETLLKGGPKVPVKQNTLFGGDVPEKVVELTVQRKANMLFPPTDENKPKRQKRVGGTKARLHKPGITIGNPSAPTLINLSKSLMGMIYKIPHIYDSVHEGYTTVRVDITVGKVDNKKLLGFKFHEHGEYDMYLKRNKLNETGLQNICIDKNSVRKTYNSVIKLLRQHDLLDKSYTNPEVAQDTLMFEVTNEEA